jgi:hypothetical protein
MENRLQLTVERSRIAAVGIDRRCLRWDVVNACRPKGRRVVVASAQVRFGLLPGVIERQQVADVGIRCALRQFGQRLSRGVTPLTPPTTSGQVSPATGPATVNISVLGLLTEPDGTVCDVAGFAEDLYVASLATDSWNRIANYDGNPPPVGFVLVVCVKQIASYSV